MAVECDGTTILVTSSIITDETKYDPATFSVAATVRSGQNAETLHLKYDENIARRREAVAKQLVTLAHQLTAGRRGVCVSFSSTETNEHGYHLTRSDHQKAAARSDATTLLPLGRGVAWLTPGKETRPNNAGAEAALQVGLDATQHANNALRLRHDTLRAITVHHQQDHTLHVHTIETQTRGIGFMAFTLMKKRFTDDDSNTDTQPLAFLAYPIRTEGSDQPNQFAVFHISRIIRNKECELEGHITASGTAAYNLALDGEEVARRACQFLTDSLRRSGVPDSVTRELSSHSKGNKAYFTANDTTVAFAWCKTQFNSHLRHAEAHFTVIPADSRTLTGRNVD